MDWQYSDWIELQNLGLNVTTISLVGTAVFGLARAYSLYLQARTIEKMKTGKSVPVIMYTYILASMIACSVYGLHTHSLALVFCGVIISLASVPVLACLWKYNQGFTRGEIVWAAVFLTVGLLMIVPQLRGIVFMIFGIGAVLITTLQPYEIARNRDSGAVDFRTLLIVLANNSFWVVYSFAIKDLLLMIINPCFLLISLIAVFLWFSYISK